MGKTEAILVELNEQSTFPACWRPWSGWGWRLTKKALPAGSKADRRWRAVHTNACGLSIGHTPCLSGADVRV